MKLSIIIPVYNVERYIRKCLLSIFSQSYSSEDIEVIIVNDGTKDNSMEIVKDFHAANIIVINQENSGLSVARNTGLEVAKGDYVWFVDSDDWVAENSISSFLNIINRYKGTDVFLFEMTEYDERGKLVKENRLGIKYIKTIAGLDYLLQNIPYVMAQMFIYNRNFLIKEELRFYPGIYHEDHEFLPHVMLHAHQVTLVPQIMYCYLKRDVGSITSSPELYDRRKRSILQIFDNYSSLIRQSHSYVERKALERKRLGILRWFWNDLSVAQWNAWKKENGMSLRIIEYKRCVWHSFLSNRRIGLWGRKLIFLISPTLLKHIKKNI